MSASTYKTSISRQMFFTHVIEPTRRALDELVTIGNYRYGSIICDLEQRRIVRCWRREPATAQAWLADHPAITMIARDRGGGYGESPPSSQV